MSHGLEQPVNLGIGQQERPQPG